MLVGLVNWTRHELWTACANEIVGPRQRRSPASRRSGRAALPSCREWRAGEADQDTLAKAFICQAGSNTPHRLQDWSNHARGVWGACLPLERPRLLKPARRWLCGVLGLLCPLFEDVKALDSFIFSIEPLKRAAEAAVDGLNPVAPTARDNRVADHAHEYGMGWDRLHGSVARKKFRAVQTETLPCPRPPRPGRCDAIACRSSPPEARHKNPHRSGSRWSGFFVLAG
jgi:hypothetical protein